jgi:hypothetical protein
MLAFLEKYRHDKPIVARRPQTLFKFTNEDMNKITWNVPNDVYPNFNLVCENLEIIRNHPLVFPRNVLHLPLPFDVPQGGIVKLDADERLKPTITDHLITFNWAIGTSLCRDIPFLLSLRAVYKEPIGIRPLPHTFDFDIYEDIPQGKAFIPVLSYGISAMFNNSELMNSYWNWGLNFGSLNAFSFFNRKDEVQIYDYKKDYMGQTRLSPNQLFPWAFPYRYYTSEIWHRQINIRGTLNVTPNYPGGGDVFVYYFVFAGILCEEQYEGEYKNTYRIRQLQDV